MDRTIRIVVLEGDETGQELLEQSLRLLDSQLLGLELELGRFDLSLENLEHFEDDRRRQAGTRFRAGALAARGRIDQILGPSVQRVRPELALGH